MEATGMLSFTTGAGPVDDAPKAPVASMRHYRLRGVNLNSCDPPPIGTCVSMPVGPLVQVTHLDNAGREIESSEPGSTILPDLTGGPFFDDLTANDQGRNLTCVVLRTRAVNGDLSSPTVSCGEDAPLYELTGTPDVDCTPDGLTHRGELVLASETTGAGGCRVAPERPSLPALLAPLLVALGGVARRRTPRR
jgi:hypothetical protein